MARPYRIYERLLAKTQQNTNTGNIRSRKRKHVARGQKENVQIEAGQENGHYNFNFPNQLMTRRQLAKHTGVPYSAIQDFIKRGLLKPIRFSEYAYEKFSPRHLEKLVLNFNKLLLFLYFIATF